MAQANINFGAFPDDPVANTIRDAFIATQTNFDQLFAGAAANANVAQIVAGDGISVSPANGVGNVTVNNIFNSLRVRSNTLSVSALGGSMDGDTVVVSNASSTLVLEINSNTNANSSLYNLSVTNELSVLGNTISIPEANAIFDNGNIVLTTGTLTGRVQGQGSNGSIQFNNEQGLIDGSSLFYFDNTLQELSGPRFNAAVITSGILDSVVANFTSMSAETVNFVTLTSNSVTGNTGVFSSNISTPTVTGNLQGNLLNGSLANSVVFYDANGETTGHGTFTFDGTNLAVGNGNVTARNFVGNLVGLASTANTVTDAIQPNIAQVGNLNILNVFGNVVVGGLVSNTHVQGANATFTNQLIGNTLTTTNFEASRANVQFGVVCNNLTANTTVNAVDVTSNTLTTTSNITTPLLKFTPRTTDPVSPNGGDVYYNAATGKLRVYNAVASQWQDLN